MRRESPNTRALNYELACLVLVFAVLAGFASHRKVSVCRLCGLESSITWWSFPGRSGLTMSQISTERGTAMSRLYRRTINAPHVHTWKNCWHTSSGLVTTSAGHTVAPYLVVEHDVAVLERVRPERAAAVLRAIDMDTYDGGAVVNAALRDLNVVSTRTQEDRWWRRHRTALAR